MDHANIQSEIIVKQTKIIERLRKEKEWLLENYAIELYNMCKPIRRRYNRESIKQRIVLEMKQALREE